MGIIALVLLSSAVFDVDCFQPHVSVKEKLGKILKSTRWNYDHSHLKIDKPISIEVISKYIIPAKTRPFKLQYKDCADIRKHGSKLKIYPDGVYTIYPSEKIGAVNVSCDMTTEGGGWTVIQRRFDGSTGFFRKWTDYKQGFGDIRKEYWLGNDIIHTLTSNGKQELRIDLQKFSGAKAYAKYSQFAIGDENAKYKLSVSGYKGTAGDGLAHHNSMKFSTRDRDNDRNGNNCAVIFTGAWWYHSCHSSNLNGHYYTTDGRHGGKGVDWHLFGKAGNSMKSTKMMIRPLKP